MCHLRSVIVSSPLISRLILCLGVLVHGQINIFNDFYNYFQVTLKTTSLIFIQFNVYVQTEDWSERLLFRKFSGLQIDSSRRRLLAA